jgi:hypothetical protein
MDVSGFVIFEAIFVVLLLYDYRKGIARVEKRITKLEKRLDVLLEKEKNS